MPAVKVGLI